MKIWIDDIRPAPDNWIWAQNYDEAIDLIARTKEIDEISFDHDLGYDSPTGYTIICQIEECIAMGFWDGKIPKFHIHSDNPVGRANIQRAIDSIKRLILRS